MRSSTGSPCRRTAPDDGDRLSEKPSTHILPPNSATRARRPQASASRRPAESPWSRCGPRRRRTAASALRRPFRGGSCSFAPVSFRHHQSRCKRLCPVTLRLLMSCTLTWGLQKEDVPSRPGGFSHSGTSISTVLIWRTICWTGGACRMGHRAAVRRVAGPSAEGRAGAPTARVLASAWVWAGA